jgi:hypothetical protein
MRGGPVSSAEEVKMPRRKVVNHRDKRPKASRWRHVLVMCPRCHKDWYTSYPQAQRMVLKALKDRETQLYIYRCPANREKYHVTKMEEHDGRGEVL